jgi:hypothetical protein
VLTDDGTLGDRGRMPTEPEPLLSVDAMEGCRMRSTVGADTALDHGAEGTPNVTVCPLELLCELGGPRVSGESLLEREELVSARSSSFGVGESGGEPKGAIAFGTLAARCESEVREACSGELTVS